MGRVAKSITGDPDDAPRAEAPPRTWTVPPRTCSPELSAAIWAGVKDVLIHGRDSRWHGRDWTPAVGDELMAWTREQIGSLPAKR